MSVERDIDVDLDPDAAVATIVERRELDELFQDGEHRLWEDASGWDGFLREEDGDDVVYYSVNRLEEDHQSEWLRELRLGEQAVRDGIQRHIEDPAAGEAGRFVRRCSPP